VTPAPPTPARVQMMEGCAGNRPMDLIWSISDQADSSETDLALNFIHDVTGSMVLGPSRVQVGLSPSSCETGSAIRLKDHDTVDGLDTALEARRYRNLPASTNQHLHYIRTQGMTATSGARADAAKFGIVIVDRPHGSNLAQTRSEAQAAQSAGIQLIVIGVGHHVVVDELNSIATSQQDVLTCSTYQELPSLMDRVTDRLCHGLAQLPAAPPSQRHVNMRRYFRLSDE